MAQFIPTHEAGSPQDSLGILGALEGVYIHINIHIYRGYIVGI